VVAQGPLDERVHVAVGMQGVVMEESQLFDPGLLDEKILVSTEEAYTAARLLARTEGIIPALESAHALAELVRRAPRMKKSDIVIVNISGRGDKDMGILREELRD